MRFPLMRNNISREDLDLVIEHLKQKAQSHKQKRYNPLAPSLRTH